MSIADVFVGVTSWNSALFLPHSLEALKARTKGAKLRIVVLDNTSSDDSAAIARRHGAEVVLDSCTQPEALNALVNLSRSPLTLLMHSDVIMLSDRWLDVCRQELRDNVGLVSPEDIGCGPLTRPFGAGKPESSFMLFTADALQRIRIWRSSGGGVKSLVPRRVIDFYGDHVTHRLPEHFAARGLAWKPMTVHWSKRVDTPIFVPDGKPQVWSDELGHLRYGLGNFYSLGGTLTHYHNWYDRIVWQMEGEPSAAVARRAGFPTGFIKAYTLGFLEDLAAGSVELPDPMREPREPKAL